MPAFLVALTSWIKSLPRGAVITVLAVALLAAGFAIGRYVGHTRAAAEQETKVEASPTGQATSAGTSASPPSGGQKQETKPRSPSPPVATAKVPPNLLIFLAGAIAVSFLLALFIRLSETPPRWSLWQAASVGSLIAVVSIALVTSSFFLSDQEPGNETVFLVSAYLLGLSLLVFAACYVPKLIGALRNIQSAFLQVSALLCISGAAGGLAYHLATHHGDLIMPSLGTVWEEVQRPNQAVAPPTETPSAALSGTPPPVAEPAVPPEKIKRRAFHIGFLGDILLGLVAANALHLALAKLIKYDAQGEDRRNQYFTFLALGILAGFGGTKVLTSWTNSLTGQEVKQLLREQISQSQSGQSVKLPQATQTAHAVTASLTRTEWPNESETALLKAFAVALKAAAKPLDGMESDEAVAAAGSEIFVREPMATTEAKLYLDKILERPDASKADRWTARMLRAFVVTCQGTAAKTPGWYNEVRDDLAQLERDTPDSVEQSNAQLLLASFAAAAAKRAGVAVEHSVFEKLEKDLSKAGVAQNPGRTSFAINLAIYALVSARGGQALPPQEITRPRLPLLRFVKAMNAIDPATMEEFSAAALAPVASPTPAPTASIGTASAASSPIQTSTP